jgi:hypothetical protein
MPLEMPYHVQYHRLPTVSQRLGVSVDFVRKQIRLNRLISSKLGRCRVVSDHDLLTYVEAQRARTVGQK